MSYIEGFVTAVPAANKDAYIKHATDALPVFKEFGVTRMVETWGDDVPDGKLTDFKGAVQARDDEVVVFSWFEYPDRAARAAANEKIMADPRMEAMSRDMPFDGKRMIYGGFDSIVDDGASEGAGYADGYLVAVPQKNREAYREMASKASAVFREYGALRVVEAWGDDVPDGKITDYRRAVKAEDGEAVVYSFVEWPSKAVRDKAWTKIMDDERMKPDPDNMPFDGKRMIYGGFSPIVDG
ncbi:DUF1428 domain-containing protein [Brevundimonas lutea]|uniref:DUF1428 domain-containing protein n=1 Tax=Brevundimonas lutea TaxID=2293980 RepID=UPI000F03A76A